MQVSIEYIRSVNWNPTQLTGVPPLTGTTLSRDFYSPHAYKVIISLCPPLGDIELRVNAVVNDVPAADYKRMQTNTPPPPKKKKKKSKREQSNVLGGGGREEKGADAPHVPLVLPLAKFFDLQPRFKLLLFLWINAASKELKLLMYD